MKKINKIAIVILSVALILGVTGPTITFAATDPGLGAAATFSIVAQTEITGTGTISGDVGLNSTGAGITALTAAMVSGTIYSTDGVAPSTAILNPDVQANLSTANDNISGQGSTASIGPVLDGLTLTPGVYDIGAGRLNGGVLTLDGSGIYIFRASSDLVSSGSINLINGARACDVYWQVNTLATINGSSFIGTIIAGTGVHFGADVALNGRALALGGDVTLLNNTISGPTCAAPLPDPQLTVTKTVVNTGGGTKVVADFPLFIDGDSVTSGVASTTSAGLHTVSETTDPNYTSVIGGDCAADGTITLALGDVKTCTITNTYTPSVSATLHIIKHVINDSGGTAIANAFTINVTGTNVSSSSFVGSEAGVDVTLDAGSYSVTEPVVPAGYLQTGSGDCSGIIAAGGTKTCTITNDDIAPQLIVNKIVVNDNSRNKVIADFPLFIDGGSVTSGVASTTTIGLHTISETSDSGYTSVIGGDCAADGTITLALGDVKTCTITNDDIATSSGGSGGSLYYAPVPPLIDVVKVPSPLALPDGSGLVKYTYTLSNIGTVPVNNVTMVGDTCSPITLISGDANADAKLDVNETWVYTCSTTITKTHTNIVTVTGWANGISATDIANATVIVGIPVVPPLIHVTKVPNPLVLSAGGGTVTYTNKVTNPGTVALSNVRLTDDKCGPVKYISGDANGNSKLDTTETWTYTCQTNHTKTTANTVTASGEANGLTARDFALATVVVTNVPKLPSTGLPPHNNIPWNIIVPTGIFAIFALFYFARRKQIT